MLPWKIVVTCLLEQKQKYFNWAVSLVTVSHVIMCSDSALGSEGDLNRDLLDSFIKGPETATSVVSLG